MPSINTLALMQSHILTIPHPELPVLGVCFDCDNSGQAQTKHTGFSPGAMASFYSTKTHMLGLSIYSKTRCKRECDWLSISMCGPCDSLESCSGCTLPLAQ